MSDISISWSDSEKAMLAAKIVAIMTNKLMAIKMNIMMANNFRRLSVVLRIEKEPRKPAIAASMKKRPEYVGEEPYQNKTIDLPPAVMNRGPIQDASFRPCARVLKPLVVLNAYNAP